MFNLNPLGKTHQNYQLPLFLSFPQPFISARISLRQLLHRREQYGKKFKLGRALILEECVLTTWSRKNPKTYIHSLMHQHFHLPSRFGEGTGHWDDRSFIHGGGFSFTIIYHGLIILPNQIDTIRASRYFYVLLQLFFLFQDPSCCVAMLS